MGGKRNAYRVLVGETEGKNHLENLGIDGGLIQGDTKEWELLKCIVAATYSWQHCGTGTLSYRQPCHPVIMEQ